MESGVIVYAFLLAGFITLCGVGLFIWINSRESTLDNKSYDQSFDPGKMVSKYRYTGQDNENYDPTKKLKRYAQPSKESDLKTAELDRLLEERLKKEDIGDVELPNEESIDEDTTEDVIDLDTENFSDSKEEKE
jgi:hypothetical protein